MKTAISLPDEVFDLADALANKLHVSRSKLYSMALEKFIHENQKEDVTAQINEYIDQHGQPVDPIFIESSVRELRKATQNDTW